MPPSHDLQKMLNDEKVARGVVSAIEKEAAQLDCVRLMEVCGTHTMAIRRHGLPSLLPKNIELLSGPGCPVCVTPNAAIDRAIALTRDAKRIVATFGDMVRVPGSRSSLAVERSKGADVRVVYSPLDAVRLAKENPDRHVVFIGVGFETTAPTVAAAVLEAEGKIKNFSVLVAHKLVPPALEALVKSPEFSVQGFICPGHVSVIIGSEAYRNLAEEHRIPCVVAGFEPVDILLCILMLLRQLVQKRSSVEVEYRAVVQPHGNPRALDLMNRVFEPEDSEWRGIGVIPGSGLRLREKYRVFDALRFQVEMEAPVEPKGCLCGRVLMGAVRPPGCQLFGTACTPANPVGPCMVSSEGTCAAYYRYERTKKNRKAVSFK
jgi:hydrogenase expression/formation protein HypD